MRYNLYRMAIQVVTVGLEELKELINVERESAYASGYLKAKKELEIVKAEPKFNEVLRGVKELKHYLEYKGYWSGSVNTLNKVAPQLLDEGDKQGHRLIFRRTCIDHAYANGFRFHPLRKSSKNAVK